jgi:hypothetical protein
MTDVVIASIAAITELHPASPFPRTGVPQRQFSLQTSAGTPDGGGAARASQPFSASPGAAFFFRLEKGPSSLSNHL